MVEEALEAFCRLRKAMDKVQRSDLLTMGVQESKLEALFKNRLVEEKSGEILLTQKGESVLINHRESYLHDCLIHGGNTRGPNDIESHWVSCHHIDRLTLKDFYECLKNMPYRIEELVPLVDLPVGKRGEVVLMVGGKGMVNRLCALGLTPETQVCVTKKAPSGGPILLGVRSTEIAIGRGVASKVLIKPIE